MGHPVFGADQSAHAEQLQGNETLLRNQVGENGTLGTENSFTQCEGLRIVTQEYQRLKSRLCHVPLSENVYIS
jgi:hypothetical protein